MSTAPTDLTYVVTGRRDTGIAFPRRDIHDLQKNHPEQFSLFILSLLAVQYPDSEIPLMPPGFTAAAQGLVPEGGYWYNLTGIHGLPYTRYVGDPCAGDLSDTGAAATTQAAAVPASKPAESSTRAAPSPAPGVFGKIAAGMGGVVKGAADAGAGLVGGVTAALGIFGGATPTLVAASPKTPSSSLPASPPVPKASTAPPGEKRFGGYCNHASVLFPPWHRPYLLALEQSIGMAAVRIAEQLAKGATDPAKAKKWTEAAKQLRWPYWDWTDSLVLTDGFPLVIKSPTVAIVSSAGTMETVPNPLAFYKFPSPMDDEFKDVLVNVPYSNGVTQKSFFSQWTRTYRWPGETATPTDDYDKVDAELKRLWVDLRAKVAHLFTYENEKDPTKWSLLWDEFSNTTVQSDPSKGASAVSKSLEAVHNSIHIIIGGAGHLGQNDYAGFDPVFWLHHANNDRIYALWEYCYPNYWVGAGYNNKNTGNFTYFTQPTGGTFYQLDHSRVDQATDMLPFRKARDAYWTPQDVRSLENRPDVLPKYYSYPAVDGLDVTASATDAQRIKLRATMQAHFGLRTTVVESSHRTFTHSSPFFANPILDTLQVPSGVNAISNYRHFLVSVTLNEHAFNDSYTFELTYKPSSEEAEVSTHVAVLSRPKSTRCAACHGRAAVGNTVRGMIHIPSSHVASLLDDFLIEDTTEDTEADVIKSAFTGKLIGRGGHVFATARSGQPVHEADKLDECITPSVKFFSAYGGLFGEEGPLSFFGWKDHREVFEGCWKQGA